MSSQKTHDFLQHIGPDFIRFTDNFVKEGFKTVKELQCIKLPDDLNLILHGQKANLAEKRQMECAIKSLQKQDDFSKTKKQGKYELKLKSSIH